MPKAPTPKSITANIVLSEPDEEFLKQSLKGRNLSPELVKFLQNLVKTKKWTRKITLPSTHDDVAVALVFASSLKETGLEIVTELHVFYNGRTIVEEWEVIGESEKTSAVPKEAFTSIGIQKVQVEDDTVHVELAVPETDGGSKNVTKSFDFAAEEPHVREVPHPHTDESDPNS